MDDDILKVNPASFDDTLARSFVLLDGVQTANERQAFVAHQPALQRDIGIAVVALRQHGQWSSAGRVKWRAAALVASKDGGPLVVVGYDGEVAIVANGEATEVDRLPGAAVGPICGATLTAAGLLAFGGNRQVFRSADGGHTWARWLEGTRPPRDPSISLEERVKRSLADLGSFNALVAVENDHYAFGDRGEIWRRDLESPWIRLDSPTNIGLEAATLASDGLIYACGVAGMLLRGIRDHWEVVDVEGLKGRDLCAIASFRKQIYVADGHAVLRLVGNRAELVDFGEGVLAPASRLHSDGQRLMTIAGKQSFLTEDGVTWICLLKPPSP